MSLLANESYANENTPLWLSAAVQSGQVGTFSRVNVKDSGNNIQVQLLTNATPGVSGSINSASQLRFGQIGSTQANTQLDVSPSGTKNDGFTVGGTVSTRYLNVFNFGVGADSIGASALTNGTVTINTTASDVNAYIFLQRTDLNASTAVGELRIQNKLATSFTVVSNDATGAVETGDQSGFVWWIVSPA